MLEIFAVLGLGAYALSRIGKALQSSPSTIPGLPSLEGYPIISVDARIVTNHAPGQLPCPPNPPPPEGWAYWTGPVSANLTAFASTILNSTLPMGSFVQDMVDGQLVAARIEWHTYQGKTGMTGCFRGVNLMKQVSPSAQTSGTPFRGEDGMED